MLDDHMMRVVDTPANSIDEAAEGQVFKVSRRQFLGASMGALVLGVVLSAPHRAIARAADGAKVEPGTRVPAFLQIREDGSVLLRSPFVEGGQGVNTAMAQMVGEELDVPPSAFIVECAPPGPDYLVMNGRRFTGGSFSVRSSYTIMRRLGASARQMLLQAAAQRLGVSVDALSTASGEVVHAASGRRLGYGALAGDALALPVPADVALKDDANFQWIKQPVERLDVQAKSTGAAEYAIDLKVDGMLLAAVQHAPRLGMTVGSIDNEAEIKAMRGVHSIHRLPGAVAVVADRWWRANKAAKALKVAWKDAGAEAATAMPADFSTETWRERMAQAKGPGAMAEDHGDVAGALASAARTVEATYEAPYLAHGQIEPPSTIARFNDDGTLELWVPNQAPEMFQGAAAKAAGLEADQVIIHSPPLGGFFGRSFLYASANPFPQAIALAKAVGRPVKLIWSREEEFLRDALRPMGMVRFKAGLDADGLPVALKAEVIGEGPAQRWFGHKEGVAGNSAVEGIAERPYAIANRQVEQLYLVHPPVIGFWRSVGHSMNAFFYEAFLDELADAGGQDPYALRLRLLAEQPRHKALLEAVGELSGGWKRGPYTADDGSQRARGVALAQPFGSEVATIAEVSVASGQVVVHTVWVAFDLGRMVNPAIIEAQVRGAVALGLSSALFEEVVYVDGQPQARNFDAYPVLRMDSMPEVHVRIIESGALMGGVGEPGLPGAPAAVANAVSALTGQRVRALPLSKLTFDGTA